MRARCAMTVMELIVVITILGLLVGLLLPAIQSVRRVAARAGSTNNQKQIALAMQNYHAGRGELPQLDPPREADEAGGDYYRHSVHSRLLPYLEVTLYDHYRQSPDPTNFQVKVFISPADPTLHLGTFQRCSYPVNAWSVRGKKSFDRSFPDGTSNTFAFAENYSNCTSFSFVWTSTDGLGMTSLTRAAFADGENGFGHTHPVTAGQPPVSRPSFPNIDAYPQLATITFQAGPPIRECNSSLAQSPDSAGMIVSLVDGSVRVISASISSPIYWGAITPSGGEILGDW